VTTVRIAITVPTADGAGRRPTGTLSWSPTKRRNEAGDLILPAPFNATVTDPPGTVEVAPTGAGWAWQVIERLTGGSPHKRILAVPDSAETVDYADLVEVDPATLDPVAEPEAAWWAALTNVGTYATDPDDPDALLVTTVTAQTDPADDDALVLVGE